MPVCHIKLHRFLAVRVYAHTFCHSLVGLLIGTDTVCRMHIQSDFHISFVKPVHKLLGIREKLPVPGISGPTASILRINIHQMPVHIYYSYRKRDLLPLKAFHQLFVFLLRIFVITAPPVSKHPAGQKGRPAAEIIQILNCLLIPVPITEEIEIYAVLRTHFHPSVLRDCHTAAVIHNRKSVP